MSVMLGICYGHVAIHLVRDVEDVECYSHFNQSASKGARIGYAILVVQVKEIWWALTLVLVVAALAVLVVQVSMLLWVAALLMSSGLACGPFMLCYMVPVPVD